MYWTGRSIANLKDHSPDWLDNAKRASTCQYQRILVISGRVNSTQWILFKGSRVVIPRVMRPEVKSRIHSSHLGVEACLRKARDTVFWPNMNAEGMGPDQTMFHL